MLVILFTNKLKVQVISFASIIKYTCYFLQTLKYAIVTLLQKYSNILLTSILKYFFSNMLEYVKTY